LSSVAAPVRYVAWVFCGSDRLIIAIMAVQDRSPLKQLVHLTADEVVTVSVLH
jgi:hypothetical protein